MGHVLGLYRNNGKEYGNYYNGLDRDYYEDPFLDSFLYRDFGK